MFPFDIKEDIDSGRITRKLIGFALDSFEAGEITLQDLSDQFHGPGFRGADETEQSCLNALPGMWVSEET